MHWLQKRIEVLYPSSSSPLRAGAADAAAFVEQLYSDEQHRRPFEDFLQSDDRRPLFAFLANDRQIVLSSSVPKPGTFSALLYFLKPASTDEVRWTAHTLSRHLQVQQAS